MTSFYVKHLAQLMRRAGADPSPENKELMDRAVREVLDMERADADLVWERVKEIMFEGGNTEEKKEFEDAVVKLMVKYLITG
jgi:hypothetical protein